MNRYPIMYSEIFDAISEYFEYSPEIQSDIMLYLKNLSVEDVEKIKSKAEFWLERHDRCQECGSTMDYKTFTADNYIRYCPVCNTPEE